MLLYYDWFHKFVVSFNYDITVTISWVWTVISCTDLIISKCFEITAEIIKKSWNQSWLYNWTCTYPVALLLFGLLWKRNVCCIKSLVIIQCRQFTDRLQGLYWRPAPKTSLQRSICLNSAKWGYCQRMISGAQGVKEKCTFALRQGARSTFVGFLKQLHHERMIRVIMGAPCCMRKTFWSTWLLVASHISLMRRIIVLAQNQERRWTSSCAAAVAFLFLVGIWWAVPIDLEGGWKPLAALPWAIGWIFQVSRQAVLWYHHDDEKLRCHTGSSIGLVGSHLATTEWGVASASIDGSICIDGNLQSTLAVALDADTLRLSRRNIRVRRVTTSPEPSLAVVALPIFCLNFLASHAGFESPE